LIGENDEKIWSRHDKSIKVLYLSLRGSASDRGNLIG
jgi:hypothetical protein